MLFVEHNRHRWTVTQMCRTLQVSTAGYYQWRQRKDSPQQQRRELIVKEVRRIHSTPRLDTYGSPRVHQELAAQGIDCSENTVAKLMKQHGIRAKTSRKYKPCTTDSKHSQTVAPNRLNQEFKAEMLNQVWLTDFSVPQQAA